MMNKRDAHTAAFNNVATVSSLLAMIDAKRGSGGMSKINRSIPLETSLRILRDAIKDRALDEVMEGNKSDRYTGYRVMSRDGLIIRNILMECA